ncbi:Transposon Tf2-6 polyprotein, partial [Choanephora cucurbitarum]
KLKKKGTDFGWNQEQQVAFDRIKQQLANLPLLKQPDFSMQSELHVDGAATAGVALTVHEQRYSIREIEALSIVWGTKKHRIYLEAGHFVIYTDRSSLQWLMATSEDKQTRLWRWCLFLQSFDFEVKYIPVKTNYVADQLSRNPVDTIQVNHFALHDDEWWRQQQGMDRNLCNLIQDNDESFQIKNGVIFKTIVRPRTLYKNQVCKVVPCQLVKEIIKFYHDSTFAGHSGSNKTKQRLLQGGFWFQAIEVQISEFTRSCQLYQKIKGNRARQSQLSITASDLPFKKVALDFSGPLPKSENEQVFMDNATTSFSEFNRQLAEFCEMFVYNNTYHATIQTSLFEVVHGRNARTPLVNNQEVKLPPLFRNATTPQRHFAETMVNNLTLAFEAIMEARTVHLIEDIQTYKIQDKVMLFNTNISSSKKPRKLAIDWSDSWMITKVISKFRFNLKHVSTAKENLNVHSYYLKPFFT